MEQAQALRKLPPLPERMRRLSVEQPRMSLLRCGMHNRFMTVNQLPEEQRHAVATSEINMVRAFGGKV